MSELGNFDKHLDKYKKVMGLSKITLRIFYKQFNMCYTFSSDKEFKKTYNYFKSHSKHLIQQELPNVHN